MDARYETIHPVDPPRPVTIDLAGFGPRRIRWGTETPQWARAHGWRPEHDVPATVELNVLSIYGDWWVYCRTDLIDGCGGVLYEGMGLLLPASVVKPRT